MSGVIQFPVEKAEGICSKIITFTSQTPEVIDSMAMGLSEEELHRRPVPDQWCIVELVCHLADIDTLVLRGRIHAMLEKERANLSSIDPNALAEKNRYIKRTFAEAMAGFRNARRESLSAVQQVSPEDWNRVGLHPRFGEVSLGSWIVAWFFHDASHLRQLLNRRIHLFREWVGGYEAGYADDLRL